MNDFLSFRKMLTPIIIQVLFWIALVVVVLSGIGTIIAGVSARGGGGAGLGGLALLVLGPIAVRIYCELLMLFFRINDTLTDIKNELQRRP